MEKHPNYPRQGCFSCFQQCGLLQIHLVPCINWIGREFSHFPIHMPCCQKALINFIEEGITSTNFQQPSATQSGPMVQILTTLLGTDMFSLYCICTRGYPGVSNNFLLKLVKQNMQFKHYSWGNVQNTLLPLIQWIYMVYTPLLKIQVFVILKKNSATLHSPLQFILVGFRSVLWLSHSKMENGNRLLLKPFFCCLWLLLWVFLMLNGENVSDVKQRLAAFVPKQISIWSHDSRYPD